MTARSIYDHLDNSPVPSPDSWAGRRPSSPARDAAHAALEAQAGHTARAMIKERAMAYALRPRELDAIKRGLFGLGPFTLVEALMLLQSLARYTTNRHFGFGGEIPAINLRGAMLYARYSRAKANKLAKRRVG